MKRFGWKTRMLVVGFVLYGIVLVAKRPEQNPYQGYSAEAMEHVSRVNRAKFQLHAQKVAYAFAEHKGELDPVALNDMRLLVECRKHEVNVEEGLLGLVLLNEDTKKVTRHIKEVL